MRSPALLVLTCSLVAALQLPLANARVGETQEDFERRLLQPFVGKFMPREKFTDPNKEAEVLSQLPFTEVRPNFPAGIRERRYWKSAVPNTLSNENGWKVHVFYQDGRSALEAYQRVGDTINDFEVMNILRANQGTSEWLKVDPDSLEGKGSAIGCNYILADGSMRAKQIGNWLMVFSTKLDTHVKEQLRLALENQTNQHADKVKNQQNTAAGSTSGF